MGMIFISEIWKKKISTVSLWLIHFSSSLADDEADVFPFYTQHALTEKP